MSAGAFQSSTFSQDHGLRLIRTRDQRVVINGTDDNGTYSLNRNTMRKHPDKVSGIYLT